MGQDWRQRNKPEAVTRIPARGGGAQGEWGRWAERVDGLGRYWGRRKREQRWRDRGKIRKKGQKGERQRYRKRERVHRRQREQREKRKQVNGERKRKTEIHPWEKPDRKCRGQGCRMVARPQVQSLRDGGGQGMENRGVEGREGWAGGRGEGGPGSPVATASAQLLHRLAPAVPAFTCWETDSEPGACLSLSSRGASQSWTFLIWVVPRDPSLH